MTSRTRCVISLAPSGTLFHHCRFPFLKTFYIVYHVSASKNRISNTKLSRSWIKGRRLTGCSRSRRSRHCLARKHLMDVDKTCVDGHDKKAMDVTRVRKQLMVAAVERNGNSAPDLWPRRADCRPGAPKAVYAGPHSPQFAQLHKTIMLLKVWLRVNLHWCFTYSLTSMSTPTPR